MRSLSLLLLALALAAPAAAQQNPLGGGGNPLAKPKTPAWVGTYTDGNVSLALVAGEGSAFTGELTVEGQSFPVSGTHTGGAQFTGSFTVGEASFGFTAAREGPQLTLVSDGTTYALTRQGAPAGPANPLANPGPKPPAPSGRSTPVELGDVDPGPVSPFKQALGWLTFGMPQGWRVQGEEPGTIVFDPGYQQGGVLEAVVIGRYGDLEPGETGKSVVDLLRAGTPELQQELATEMGIQVSGSGDPTSLELNGQSGGFLEWQGVQQSDGTGVTVWLGGVANGGRFFTVIAIVQKGRESAYLPKARRILATSRVAAPKPGEQPAVSLAGHEVFHESSSGSGSFSTTYEFGQGGYVKKTSYFSAAGLGGEGATTEDTGTYSVSGTTVRMQFKDGAEQGTLVLQGGQLTGIQFGNALYHARR